MRHAFRAVCIGITDTKLWNYQWFPWSWANRSFKFEKIFDFCSATDSITFIQVSVCPFKNFSRVLSSSMTSLDRWVSLGSIRSEMVWSRLWSSIAGLIRKAWPYWWKMVFGVFDLLAREALMEKVKIKMRFIFMRIFLFWEFDEVWVYSDELFRFCYVKAVYLLCRL